MTSTNRCAPVHIYLALLGMNEFITGVDVYSPLFFMCGATYFGTILHQAPELIPFKEYPAINFAIGWPERMYALWLAHNAQQAR